MTHGLKVKNAPIIILWLVFDPTIVILSDFKFKYDQKHDWQSC